MERWCRGAQLLCLIGLCAAERMLRLLHLPHEQVGQPHRRARVCLILAVILGIIWQVAALRQVAAPRRRVLQYRQRRACRRGCWQLSFHDAMADGCRLLVGSFLTTNTRETWRFSKLLNAALGGGKSGHRGGPLLRAWQPMGKGYGPMKIASVIYATPHQPPIRPEAPPRLPASSAASGPTPAGSAPCRPWARCRRTRRRT